MPHKLGKRDAARIYSTHMPTGRRLRTASTFRPARVIPNVQYRKSFLADA